MEILDVLRAAGAILGQDAQGHLTIDWPKAVEAALASGLISAGPLAPLVAAFQLLELLRAAGATSTTFHGVPGAAGPITHDWLGADDK